MKKVTAANLAEAKVLYKKAKSAYYNEDSSIMTDAEFDKLEDQIKMLDPSWVELKKTGVKVKNKKTEVDHEHYLPSLPKAYPEAIEKWYAKFPSKKYIKMAKLDGSSLALTYEDGKPVKLVTRGDGARGGDVSFLIPHLNIPKKIEVSSLKNTQRRMTFRVEALMKKSVFEKKWARKVKGKEGFDNIRNMTNGLFNRTDAHPALGDVDIVVLGVYGSYLKSGLATARAQGFNVVWAKEERKGGDKEVLAGILSTLDYECDGVVIAPNDFHYEYESADLPKGIVAYKENDETNAPEAEVKKIIYQISGYGRIIPKVELKPVDFGGVVVRYATVHNAQWMLDRKIGPGAVVKLVRSGDVIPKIVGVTKAGKIQLPDVEFSRKGVHFVTLEKTDEQSVKQMLQFFQVMEIENIAKKSLDKLFDSGLTDVRTIIKMADRANRGSFDKVALKLQELGLGEAMSKKILKDTVRALYESPIRIEKMLLASPCFDVGVGRRRLDAIQKGGVRLLSLLSLTPEEVVRKLMEIDGFGLTTARVIATGMEAYKKWIKPIQDIVDIVEISPKKKPKKGALTNTVVSWTGYRDKAQEAVVEQNGGEVANFGARTTVLLYKEGGKASSKVNKAGDRAMTWSQFERKYLR